MSVGGGDGGGGGGSGGKCPETGRRRPSWSACVAAGACFVGSRIVALQHPRELRRGAPGTAARGTSRSSASGRSRPAAPAGRTSSSAGGSGRSARRSRRSAGIDPAPPMPTNGRAAQARAEPAEGVNRAGDRPQERTPMYCTPQMRMTLQHAVRAEVERRAAGVGREQNGRRRGRCRTSRRRATSASAGCRCSADREQDRQRHDEGDHDPAEHLRRRGTTCRRTGRGCGAGGGGRRCRFGRCRR